MAVGRPPFTGDDVQVLYSHLRTPVTPPNRLNSDVPHALTVLVLRLLTKDSEARPATAAEVLEDLEELHVSVTAPASAPHNVVPVSPAPGLLGPPKEKGAPSPARRGAKKRQ